MYHNKRVCVVIPVYKVNISVNEILSITNTLYKLKNFDCYFVTYKGQHIELYKKYKKAKFKYFDKEYFMSVSGYNKLLLTKEFYQAFREYEYILIVQTDAFILKSEEYLIKIIDKKYDYWGAPWFWGIELQRFQWRQYGKCLDKFPIIKWILLGPKKNYFVGNGGLSLRNVHKTIRLLREKWIFAKSWEENEDLFFAVHGSHNLCKFRVAPAKEAEQFALETNMKRKILENNVPFGVHAWEKYYPDMLENENLCLRPGFLRNMKEDKSVSINKKD